MAAQTLDQVLSSLNGVYQPQLDSVAQQQAALPAQYAAQQQGLDATQQQAFGDILNGARARGTGVAFGGIPLGEQAQYTASTYLPAVANLKTAQTQQQQSLADSINKINEDKFNTANNLYQFGVTADQNQQQIDATKAATAASQFHPTTTPPTNPTTTPAAAKASTDPVADAAYAFIKTKAAQGTGALVSDFNAALKYYNQTGNNPDFVKLNLYKQLYPAMFGNVNFAAPGQINTATTKATF